MLHRQEAWLDSIPNTTLSRNHWARGNPKPNQKSTTTIFKNVSTNICHGISIYNHTTQSSDVLCSKIFWLSSQLGKKLLQTSLWKPLHQTIFGLIFIYETKNTHSDCLIEFTEYYSIMVHKVSKYIWSIRNGCLVREQRIYSWEGKQYNKKH